MTFELTWTGPSGREQTHARTVDDVLSKIDALAAELGSRAPMLVSVSHPIAGSMDIGVGGARSIASHIPADGNPPYSLARGGGPLDGEPPSFEHEGEPSEFPPWASLELDVARECLREFCVDGTLSALVRWETG